MIKKCILKRDIFKKDIFKKGILKKSAVISALAIMLVLSGCDNGSPDDGNDKNDKNVTDDIEDKNTPTPAVSETEAPADAVEGAVQINIDSEKEFQEIRGFGAGFTYYSDYVYWAQYKDEVYDLLFKDANLTMLRFKNAYKYDEQKDYDPKVEREFYEKAKERLAEDGLKPEVLLSSWTPAQYLKDSEALYGEGTLIKDKDGNYEYGKLGEYWAELVDYYYDNGVPLDYISIQNEPDFVASYESCTFDFEEREGAASYPKAFLAVYNATRQCRKPPKMVGPDTMTCNSGDISLIVDEIIRENPDSLFGIAHHLYVGGEEGDAKSFNVNFRGLASDYPDIEKWMTEYYRGDFMFTVQIIQNCMTVENLNAYIYWGGAWKAPAGKDLENLIGIDSGKKEEDWFHEHGYVIGEKYYSMRHFSEYILPGYTRIGAFVDMDTVDGVEKINLSADDVSCSAYVSPEKDRMVLVAVNDLDEPHNYQFRMGDYKINNSKVILTNYENKEDTESFYQDAGSLDENGCFEIPAHSVVTVVIDGSAK